MVWLIHPQDDPASINRILRGMTMSTPAPMFTRYRAAAIQYEPTLGEKEKNVADLLHLVKEAAQHNARLIVLPEMATTGYCWESRTEIAPYVEQIGRASCRERV